MMKRTLSFLLCLIMVVSLAAPSVQASSTDDVITSDNIMDNVYIENGSDANIVIDGNTVNTSQDNKLPNPADLVTEPTEPPYLVGAPVVEEPATEVGCECADLASAVKHSGVCLVKAPYMELCGNASAEELYAQWGNYTLVEQDFIQDYLYEAFPQKSSELEKLLNAPTGSASETLNDGTTVSVEGIPQDGSLTVGSADSVKDIVDAYVEEQEESVSPLFSYDVSVQDGQGADWQPEVNVKMELDMPGEKLHKNTKVFVVHVDDNGVATTIPAQVTEDGKIAFETPGFSAFYGFTVDFDYEGVQFSIPGMSSVKLSELFENLKMPLNASDVVNVEYTDETQLKIEQLEGDWLLTSLKAFTTEEKLTLTMADGAVYQVKVTDAVYPKVYVGSSTTNADSNNNGEITWNADTDGGGLTADGWSRTEQVEITGTGTMIINIQNNDDYTAETLYVDLYQLKITGGAHVKLRAGGAFLSSNKRVCIRSSAHCWDSKKGDAMIWVDNGSLEIVGRDVASTGIDLVFGGKDNVTYSDANKKNTSYSTDYGKWPLILLGSGATSLSVSYAEFMHSSAGAIGSQSGAVPSALSSITLSNCIFNKSVYNETKLSGGAVQMKSTGAATSFSATNCTFSGNECTYRGGAVSIDNDITSVTFDTCTFTGVSSQNHAGAIGIGKDGDVAVSVGSLTIKNCGFNSCSAAGRGGALRMLSKGSPTVTIQNSTFYNCSAGTNGGAVTLQGSVGNVSITGTKTTSNGTTTYSTYFNNCSALGRGGAIDGSCISYGTITLTNISFSNNTSGSHGGAAYFGTNGSTRHTAQAVSVTGCNFQNNQGQGIGGGLCLIEGTFASVSLTNTTFNQCRTSGFGGGFGMKTPTDDSRATLDVVVTGDTLIQNCTFTNCHGGGMQPDGYQDTAKTIPVTWDHDANPATPEIDKLNGTGGGGAIALGGIYSYVEIVGNTNNHMLLQNSTSWNNGGAILFHTGMKVTGKTVDGKKVGVRLQYLNIDKCFARDSGNAIYLSSVQFDPFEMFDCTVQYCDSFDVALEVNKANFTPLITGNQVLADLNFGTPTVKKVVNGKEETDTAATEALRKTLLTRWKGYSNENLFESIDNGGTIRTIGDSAVNAIFDRSTIQNNGSFGGGGGLYWNANNVVTDDNGNVTLTPKISVRNTDFIGNRAGTYGGGLYCEAYVELLSCNFTENSAGYYGGAISQGTYNNADRQLGASGATETNNMKLGTAEGSTQPTKIYNNTAKNGGGISITVSSTNSYPHDLKPQFDPNTTSMDITSDAYKEAIGKPENWDFHTDFSYEFKFELGGAHVYNNVATENGGGIYYSVASYKDPEGNILEGTDANKILWSERQRQLDSFKKDITINNGLIYGNIAGQDVSTHASMVTDASTLKPGDKLIIAAKGHEYAMSTKQNTDDFGQAGISSDDKIRVTFGPDTEVLTLEKSNYAAGSFHLKTTTGEYYNSDNTNQITTATSKSANNSWMFTIKDSTTGKVRIESQGNAKAPWLRYKYSINAFAHFSATNTETVMKDIGVFRLISSNAEENVAELLTSTSDLKAGDRVIISTLDNYLSMSKRSTGNVYRHHVVITRHTTKTLTFGADTEELTLEAGTVDGTYALKTQDKKYLATSSSSINQLNTVGAKDNNGSWSIKIHAATGAAFITAEKGQYTNNQIRFNTDSDWFKAYPSTSNEGHVAIYKVAQTVPGGKLAKLVTSASDLRQGDKIIIVAMGEEQALSTTQGQAEGSDGVNVARGQAPVTKHKAISFGPDTQVVTLVKGETDGTLSLKIAEGKYLRTGGSGLKTYTSNQENACWNISIDKNTGAATISNKYQGTTQKELGYNAETGVFSAYNSPSNQAGVVLYRLETVETGVGGSGGGLYMNSNQSEEVNGGYSKLQISGGSIYSNTAYVGNGGGIYLQGENALCTITGDTTGIGTVCTKSGSTVSLSPDNGNTVTGVRIDTNNYHGGNGGGIAIFGGARIEMTGGYVYNNSASTAGGGIAVHGGSTMLLTNGYVDNNIASMGGGISLNAAKGTGNAANINTQYGMYFNGGNIRNNRVTPNTDGIAYGGGICIADSATMKLAGGEISGNTAANTTEGTTFAAGQEGGGIAVCQGSDLVIQNGSISGNKAYNGGGLAIRGDSTVTLSGSLTTGTDKDGNKDVVLDSQGSITRNYAEYFGAGVYMADKTVGGSVFNMVNGYIAYNETSTRTWTKGGGIYLGKGCRIELTGGRIEYNKAYDGGAILGWQAVMDIKNGVIKGNTARRNGGGIYDDYGKVTLTGGKIYNNTAGQEGGGIFCWSECWSETQKKNLYTPAELIISGGSIFNNSAANKGGGVFVDGGVNQTTHGTATITGGDIYSNTTNGLGGGLYVQDATLTMSQNGSIRLNTAQNGGGAYLKSSISTISNGTVDGNTASKKGGGIAVVEGGSINFTGGTIKNNEASEEEGGGIYINASLKIDISNGAFESNVAGSHGGAICAEATEVNITGGRFIMNRSGENGGAVNLDNCKAVMSKGTASSKGATFTLNTAGLRGGAVCVSQNKLEIAEGTFNSNAADTNGGAIYATYATVEITGGTFTSNISSGTKGGGAMCLSVCGTTISSGIFNTNSSIENGGGLYVEKGMMTMNGGTISGNTAGGNGGGVYADGGAKVYINGTDYQHGEISENTANNGGGVYVTGGGELYVHDGYIINNSAAEPAGSSGLATVMGKLSSLYGSGGGICVTTGASETAPSTFTLTGDNMAIYGNTATFAGDDVCSNGVNTKLDVPEVTIMNLAGYGFNPEGWVEDYAKYDSMYSKGLNMLGVYGVNGTVSVLRYRNAAATQRRFMLIKPEYVSGTGNAANAVYANKPNAYVCMTLGIPTAMDDTVVIDYGSEVLINAWLNDLFLRNEDDTSTNNVNENDFRVDGAGTTEGGYLGYSFTTGTNTGDIKKYEDTCYLPITEKKAPQSIYTSSRKSIKSNYGDVWTGQNGTYSYTPKVKSLDKVDSFFYTVAHNGFWYYAKMNIVPATTIYYEDNFGEWGNNTPWINYHTTAQHETLAGWDSVKDGIVAAKRQDEDRPGGAYMEGIDHDNAYGYDSSYSTSTKFSDGTAHKVRVYRNADGSTVNARATFTFTGTGFDIISYCSTGTGVVSVSVWQGTADKICFEDNPKTPEYDITTPIATYATDTYYQNGGTTGLYQVPVIKADLTQVPVYDQNWNATGEYYGYGTYTVEIYVAPGWYPKDHSYNGCEFYLDAIRIYDPVGYNGSQSQVAQNAYLADGEGWPVYQELRNMILSKYDMDSEAAQTPREGIFFIDGTTEKPSLANYASWGPNNEMYIRGTTNPDRSSGIVTLLDGTKYAMSGLVLDRVHIGIRALSGTGKVAIYHSQPGSNTISLFGIIDLSSTDMYYDITGLMDQNVSIYNIGTSDIAISNLKITHKEKPKTRGTIVTAGQETVNFALSVFNAEQLAEVTVTPKRPALSFNGMVCYNVFFDAQDLGDLTAADLGLAVFNSYAPDGTVENANEVHLGAEEIDGLYMVATDGVHAKYLGDAKFFRAFAKKADGSYVYSKMVSYSAVDYAKNILAKSDDVKLKQLVVAMLNYGAEAQKFFGYKTYNLMNKDLTADDLALLNGFDANSLNKVGKVDSTKVGAFASTGGFTKRSPAISFKGAFEINYFMTPAYAVDGDMTMYFWTEDTYNSVTELTADNADKAVVMTPENGSYTACSDEIIAKYLDKTVYVAAVYESNGVTYCSGVLPYSIAAYCQKPPASVQDLATAAAIYGCTAKQYFGA